MRIIHIIVGLKPHGAEIMLKRLIENRPGDIPNTVVVSLTSLDVIGRALRERGVKVYALNMSSAWSAPWALWHLIRLIRREQPDIVQTWMYHADLLGGLAARLAGRRNIVWGVRRTALSFNDMAQTALVMKICAVLSHWVPRRIICVAEAARTAHIEAGYCARSMVVIPNGFDFSLLSATLEQRLSLRRASNFNDGDVVIGTVGRFHPDKGQLNFVKAASIVSQQRANVKFLMVGRGCDKDNTSLLDWLTHYGLLDRFVLLGERKDVPVCLAAMDIFCMPSRTEGFPNGLGEAMAMGLPCVATRVGDTHLLAGDTVDLVPPDDEYALAQGLMRILALSTGQREEIIDRARVRVRSEFSIETARERFDAIYRQLLSEGKV